MFRNFKSYSLLALAISFIFLFSISSYTQEQKQKTVQHKYYAGQPVEIIDLRLQGVSVKPNQKFNADSNWLNGMTVTLKNVSHKPIAYISVLVSAYYEKNGSRIKRNEKETQTGVELRYGMQPARTDEQNFSKGEVLLPNETINIDLTGELRDEFNSRLSNSSIKEFKEASSDV